MRNARSGPRNAHGSDIDSSFPPDTRTGCNHLARSHFLRGSVWSRCRLPQNRYHRVTKPFYGGTHSKIRFRAAETVVDQEKK